MSSNDATTGGNIAISIVSVITGGIVVIVVSMLIYKCVKLHMLRKYGYHGQAAPPVLPLVAGTTASVSSSQQANRVVSITMTSGSKNSSSNLVDVVKDRPVRFSSLQLQEFTGGYAEKLGAGGFGAVYKGHIPLPDCDSLAVAVKVLHAGMGKRAEEQFMAEIGTIGRTSHVNLVRLYGFCFDADLKALVYEFMPNGSLEGHLFTNSDNNKLIGFDTLFDIAVGTGKAIRYLHGECERRIIHYDIKPGNVLLDESFRPKVADFGLARLCDRERTHLTRQVAGVGPPGTLRRSCGWEPPPRTSVTCTVMGCCCSRFSGGDGTMLTCTRTAASGGTRGGCGSGSIAARRRPWWRRRCWLIIMRLVVGRMGEEEEGGEDVRGGAVVRAVPAGGPPVDERRREDAGGRRGRRGAGGEPLRAPRL